MTYTTGSGAYTDLMDDVLTHAVTDGWTEVGGVGTGYPLRSPSSGVTYFDWGTYTAAETDFTVGATGGAITARYMRLGLGTSGALATSNAITTTTKVPNMNFDLDAYYIFSDPTVADSISVVYKVTNRAGQEVYGNFSFGQVAKNGLTYGAISFATGDDRRAYAPNVFSGTQSTDHNAFLQWRPGYCGNVGMGSFSTEANLSFITHATSAPHPSSTTGWPAHDTVHEDGTYLWCKGADMSENQFGGGELLVGGFKAINHLAWTATAPSQTGTITLMPFPFLMINSTGTGGALRYMGTFPIARKANMNNVLPAEEVSFSSDTWKVFPIGRNTPWTDTGQAGVVSSGRAGIAFKKVV